MTRDAGPVFHPDVAALARVLAERPGAVADVVGDVRRAAVALLLREREGVIDILFIKRAEYASDPWSGQAALPGGRMEAQDASLADTAARETFEEIGIDIRVAGTILGTLDEVYPRTPVLPPVVVRPFVVALHAEVHPSPSHEVADVFWVPLERLRRRDSWKNMTVHAHGRELLVNAYRHDAYVIWGLTERVLQSLVDMLPESANSHAR